MLKVDLILKEWSSVFSFFELKKYCEQIYLKRLDESDNFTEYTYTIISKNINNLNKIKNKIREYEKAVSISFLDNSV